MIAYVTELNSDNFDEKIKSSEIVIVDVKAEWCGPCKALSPIIDQVAAEIGEKCLVGKLDADSNPDICNKLGVTNIPTLLYFKNGDLKERTVGMKTKKDILTTVNNLLTSEDF